jgi:hypothetical protein
MERQRRAPLLMLRAGGRGLMAAMAMSGTRTITSNLDLMEETPPRKIVERHGPRPLQRLPERHVEAVSEIVHWVYGAGGGAAFGLLPAKVRSHPVTGPAFGLAVWIGFELGIGPLLGVEHRKRKVLGRLVLALDHVLYGVVVAGRLAPEPEIIEEERRSRP